ARTFERHAIDRARLAIGGFSDGASCALSIGLINGDLFTDSLACSPGFMTPTRREGRPRVFISHGVQDAVLPIDCCRRRIAPILRTAGHAVDYHEFAAGHIVPDAMREAAVAWFLAGRDEHMPGEHMPGA
ncbi:MAG: phospholipase, partial [Nannocystis sp.]